MLWMTLVASTLNLECDVPILTARPKDWPASWAAVHSEMRYWLGATLDIWKVATLGVLKASC